MSNKQANTEQAILAAAEQEFIAKGLDGSRTTSIAAAAGVTHSMLHYYFRTKEALFKRVLEEKSEFLLNSVRDAYFDNSSGNIIDRIINGAIRHFDFLADNPGLAPFILSVFQTHPELIEERFTYMRNNVEAMLERLQKELDAASDAGIAAKANIRDIFVDILSLNICSLTYYPVVNALMPMPREQYIARRREENIITIKKRLMP